jgi:hypothetical protein
LGGMLVFCGLQVMLLGRCVNLGMNDETSRVQTYCLVLVQLERFWVVTLEGVWISGFFGNVGPV